MKYAIRAALLIIIIFLTWKIYRSIASELEYAAEVQERESAIVEKLKVIKEAEMAYKDVHERFTGSFDTLTNFMKNGYLRVVRAYGDKDDSTTVFRQVIDSVSVRDSLFADVDIDNIRYVPMTDKVEFEIDAGFITKNNVRVPVFQVTDPEPLSRVRIEDDDPLRVGNMFDVDYNGNWSKNL